MVVHGTAILPGYVLVSLPLDAFDDFVHSDRHKMPAISDKLSNKWEPKVEFLSASAVHAQKM